MKFLAVLFILSLTLHGQSTLDGILAKGLKQAVAGLTPIPQADRDEVVAATAALLSRHVTFRPDGTASTVSTAAGSRQNLEWKDLTIHIITAKALNEADRLNGITKRYSAILSSQATRRWDTKANSWTQWSPGGHSLFPSSITVEWKNGIRAASGGTYLPKFFPGPGPSIADAQAPKKIETLPPGMSRGK